MSAPERATTIADVRAIAGWLTDAQAGRLWDAAARAAARSDAPGKIVEIGSFRGRSTVVLARAGGQVTAIDPHLGGDRGPRELADAPARGEADRAAFAANLAAAGVAARVRHVRARSQDARAAVAGPVALLYVDGAHRLRPAGADLRHWGGRVAPGGTLLVHDAFSSVGVTLALAALVVGRDGWRYAGRDGSLAEYRRGPRLTGAERARELGAAAAQLPWFAANLARKLSIVAGRPGTWPY